MNSNHSDKGVPLEVKKNEKLVTNLMSCFFKGLLFQIVIHVWDMKHETFHLECRVSCENSKNSKKKVNISCHWNCVELPQLLVCTLFLQSRLVPIAILSHLLCSSGDIKSQWPPASLQTRIWVPALMRRQWHLSHGIWNTPTNSFEIAVTLGECTV